MKTATKRQTEVLGFIKSCLKRNQYSPTIREIASHFHISVKGAYDHVKALEKKKLISCQSNRSRTISLIEYSGGEQVSVPILGHVAAGAPIFAEENYNGMLSLPEAIVGKGKVFALRVDGDSMIGASIEDGDFAIFNKQEVAENGQIVVVRMDDTVTLKRFFKEENRIRLQSENPAYAPFYKVDVQIIGRIVAVIHTF